MLQMFETKPRVRDNFDFYGTQVNSLKSGICALVRPYCSMHLKLTTMAASFETFLRARALLSWLKHTRLDLAYITNWTFEVFQKTSIIGSIMVLNNEIKQVKLSKPTYFSFHQLEFNSLNFSFH